VRSLSTDRIEARLFASFTEEPESSCLRRTMEPESVLWEGKFVGLRRLDLSETGNPNVLIVLCDQFPLVSSSAKYNISDAY
jgi:hypothetical protein